MTVLPYLNDTISYGCLGVGPKSHVQYLCFLDVWKHALVVVYFDELRRGILLDTPFTQDAQKIARLFLEKNVREVITELAEKSRQEKPYLLNFTFTKEFLEGKGFEEFFDEAVALPDIIRSPAVTVFDEIEKYEILFQEKKKAERDKRNAQNIRG